MDPDTRALSAQLCYMLIMVCQEGAQKLLEHAGDTEGGVGGDCWTSTSRGPQDDSVRCCKSSSTMDSLETRAQPWTSSRCYFAGTPRCLVRTSGLEGCSGPEGHHG